MSIGDKAERNAMMTFMPILSSKPRSPLCVALWPVTRDHRLPFRYTSLFHSISIVAPFRLTMAQATASTHRHGHYWDKIGNLRPC
ncbi:uncharacterized protein BO87DRAFT_440728 [Aspergillus neoniger CBS 115656]|uniref:Uncharacterized protein n=1 Tax=Aspergillus neoniger (strain CBS 115656) TaxID=1448310 RepID=A0A318YHR2_ASPNB|nr:hypothetical protein BO87DRAFT_440728 [Aspergillus neoniger CBS 115656]PYH32120.1 hypothetical protein BO87DRAFT_440728 [Aspergillus neoniger CBS 115656]